jgi:biopolymer transport protein ExbD
MRSPIPKKHARIEIIPLIDIMFFLLASFMMVSLSQTHMKGIRVNLPSANAQPPPPGTPKDYTAVRVTSGGNTYFDNALVPDDQVLPRLFDLHQKNPEAKVSISADKESMHGDVITLLDRVRTSGITKIGYQVKAAAGEAGAPGAAPPPAAPPPPSRP